MEDIIEINPEFEKALDILENTSKNIFITGKAGTGKSTLLEYFRGITRRKVVVLAPTGVAAVNVKGETIHSFFRFKANITPDKVKKVRSGKRSEVYKKIDTIIIDEISMVRADLLDCVDRFLRLNRKYHHLPFGGVRMVFFGDLYQLSPVVLSEEKKVFNSYYRSSYFFDAKVFEKLNMEFLELNKIYRQKDARFIRLLNGISNNTITDDDLKVINRRVNPEIDIGDIDYCVYLTPTNKLSAKINLRQLKKLKPRSRVFNAEVEGLFNKRSLPTDMSIRLRVGAQVMLLNNDEYGRWINGTIGKVVEIKRSDPWDVVFVELPGGRVEEVLPHTWELFHFQLSEKTGELESQPVGKFVQYPLKLAWAITIHKSQGKTFDNVIIDVTGGAFACGQVYVAMSRCRTMEGIILKTPIKREDIKIDWKTVDFLTRYQYEISERDLPLDKKVKLLEAAVAEDAMVDITYLKRNNERSRRIIKPVKVGEMDYKGKSFIGVEGYCLGSSLSQTFRIDRILSMDRHQTDAGERCIDL